jgi:putative transposase
VCAEFAGIPHHVVRASAFGMNDLLVTPHRDILSLPRDPTERRACHQSLLAAALSDAAIAEIRDYLGQQRALGSERFQRAIERTLGRYASVRPAHRPAALPAARRPHVRTCFPTAF